ncbi:MAG: Sec-independent protein translocase subunit TatA/TatB [Planctomycetota bacterium]|jgi:sec-independent protein translocase protein TatA
MTVAAHTFGLLGFVWPGGPEWVILLVLGLLIFGRRLPEVGRSLGKGIVEFKRGIKGIEDEVETESSRPGQIGATPGPPGLEPPAESRVSREGAQAVAERAAASEVAGEPVEPAEAGPAPGEAERAPS